MRRCALMTMVATATALLTGGADARVRQSGGVPDLDVKSSCTDAQKFSTTTKDDKSAFRGCMQDEMKAKDDLAKRWSSFNGKDRQDCVEQGRTPSPSYVEVLTCLEMSTDAVRNGPKVDGKPVPQIGGPVATGLAGPQTGPSPPAAPSSGPSTTPPVH